MQNDHPTLPLLSFSFADHLTPHDRELILAHLAEFGGSIQAGPADIFSVSSLRLSHIDAIGAFLMSEQRAGRLFVSSR